MPDLQTRELQRARRRAGRVATACASPTTSSAVLRGFDADVIVVQEAWWPDDEPAAVDVRRRASSAPRSSSCASDAARSNPGRTSRVTVTAQGDGRTRRSSAAARRACAARSPVGPCFGDPTPERGGVHVELDVDGSAGRPRRRAPHVAAPLRPADPAATTRAAASRRRGAPPSSPATATSGAPACARSCPAGGARCAGARGRRAGRTARSTTSSCAETSASWWSTARCSAVGSDHRPVRATLRVP